MAVTVRFLADGHTVLLTSTGGAVLTLDTNIDHWVAAACDLAGRNLSDTEWTDAFGERDHRQTCPGEPAGGRTAVSTPP